MEKTLILGRDWGQEEKGTTEDEMVGWHRQHIKKQKRYFANKRPSSKAMVFPVVRYGCESWTTKKAERQRIDAFELWC